MPDEQEHYSEIVKSETSEDEQDSEAEEVGTLEQDSEAGQTDIPEDALGQGPGTENVDSPEDAPGQASDTEDIEAPGPIMEKKKRPWNFIFLLLAGILAIISPFIFLIGGGGGSISVTGLHNFGPEFAYGWAIPFLGIAIIIYAIRVHKHKMRIFAIVNLVIGPILIALPFIIANHWLYKFDENELSIPELFFGIGDGWHIYLGGIFAIIAGILAIIFGYRMFKEKEESSE